METKPSDPEPLETLAAMWCDLNDYDGVGDAEHDILVLWHLWRMLNDRPLIRAAGRAMWQARVRRLGEGRENPINP